ncbi:beta-class carbonic anhydrase [Tepidibacillus decaturensis]|uniref:carbonic anhydrase n=1 Tax=Tepidibacillus decaturensis TaxID=1413211 RepID=A0A135L6T5_9BACI|nr:carbonic anhydrase [Tepidibacillus decaturensis]KXG44698.1 carbonic anhydrase [Tepidibacillus decaturensis]
MEKLYEILAFNETFVENTEYERYQTSKFPNKKIVVLTCMDTRLVELLPQAMNIKNGDIKMIKNAGAIVSHPFGSAMKSILVALYELQAEEVMVIGHYDCGMSQIDSKQMIKHMKERSISEEVINTLEHSGIPLVEWLSGFESVEENVKHSVQVIKNHPLLPKGTPVHGLIIDPHTGRLDLIVDGYK